MRKRLACIALALAAPWSATVRAKPAADGSAFFERKIRPVLEQRCIRGSRQAA